MLVVSWVSTRQCPLRYLWEFWEEGTIGKMKQQVEELKEEVKEMLMESHEKPLEKKTLELIDAIQRLGVAYHFDSEIDGILEKIYHHYSFGFVVGEDHDDLYIVALWFRLLRQHGYHISSDIFNKFKDGEGNFKASLTVNVPGMISLFEAAHLRIRGEEILDEALAFTTTHLQSMVNDISHHLAQRVTLALRKPIRKNIPRWYKNLDIASQLPYARDRVIEFYFCIMGVYFEPQYSVGRQLHAKFIAIASIIDDTYDAYGTYEELKLFTKAVKRWDISAVDVLPDYMKVVYQFEGERGHVASAVECYMKQHGVVEEKEAYKALSEGIENAWRDINQELLKPTAVGTPLLERVLNLSRSLEVMYDGDSYTVNPHMLQQNISLLLKDPIPNSE
ncbi:hypothetical protein FNV43_RR15161 [Rhamnella rubrinervis]|uniref:Uncharacterized protein n=1 Tax=Rhamnella rubrinervis TaxID=2594499 RepID=A0A8K0E5Y1_9ROSA|nr:hypothetical protein FNV43_RR15161 [Rhamnella rubrinervis]